MNLEFHYYIVRYLAQEAGLGETEADTVAYASAFVDACIIPYTIDTGDGLYEVRPTQNYAFWDDATSRDIYLPFHFVPAGQRDARGAAGDGGPAARADGRSNPMAVGAGSAVAKELLVAALKTRNPYRVGIGLHAFADTWAHQNFSGLSEDWNVIDRRLPLPPAGHAQALKFPDDLAGVWSDPRLAEPEVVNRDRFRAAARMVYRYLATYTRKGYDDIDLVTGRMEDMWGPPGHEREREERRFEYIIATNCPEFDRHTWLHEAGIWENGDDDTLFAGYDKLLWLRNEMKSMIRLADRKPIALGRDFYRSELHRFCEAAEAHRAEARRIRAAHGLGT